MTFIAARSEVPNAARVRADTRSTLHAKVSGSDAV
jgi:hypothetical protein